MMNDPETTMRLLAAPPLAEAQCSADIQKLEQALEATLKMARAVHNRVMIEFSGDGPAHPSLGLMELSVRALAQSNAAARYCRHALPPNSELCNAAEEPKA